jgi:hypothetical protein
MPLRKRTLSIFVFVLIFVCAVIFSGAFRSRNPVAGVLIAVERLFQESVVENRILEKCRRQEDFKKLEKELLSAGAYQIRETKQDGKGLSAAYNFPAFIRYHKRQVDLVIRHNLEGNVDICFGTIAGFTLHLASPSD